MAETRRTVPVSRRALHQRLNRRLNKVGYGLYRDRSTASGYFVVDGKAGVREAGTLAALAEKFGALKPWESTEEGGTP